MLLFSAPDPGPPPPLPAEFLSPRPVKKTKETKLAYRQGNWAQVRPASGNTGYLSLPPAYPVPAPPQYGLGFRYQQPLPKSRIVEVSESEESEEESSSSSSSSEEEDKTANVFRYLEPPHGALQQQQQQIVSAQPLVQTPPPAPMIPFHYCVQCMRPRSWGYHRHHPIMPGQPPSPGVCRHCEKRNKALEMRKSSGTTQTTEKSGKSGMSMSDGEMEYTTRRARVQVTTDRGEEFKYRVRRFQRSRSESFWESKKETATPAATSVASPRKKTVIRVRHVSPPPKSPSPDIVRRVVRIASDEDREALLASSARKPPRPPAQRYPSTQDFLMGRARLPSPVRRRSPSPEIVYRTVYRTVSDTQKESPGRPEWAPSASAPKVQAKSPPLNAERKGPPPPVRNQSRSPEVIYRTIYRTTSSSQKEAPKDTESAARVPKIKAKSPAMNEETKASPPSARRRSDSPEIKYRGVYRRTSTSQKEVSRSPPSGSSAPKVRARPTPVDSERGAVSPPNREGSPSPETIYRTVNRMTSTAKKEDSKSPELSPSASKAPSTSPPATEERKVSFSESQRTEIQKIARDYYDSRQEAERRIASHPSPFSHGRFVPVENDSRPRESQETALTRAASPPHSAHPPPQVVIIERSPPITYRMSADGPYQGTQQQTEQASKTTTKSPPQERAPETTTTTQYHRKEVYYSSSPSPSPPPTRPRSPEENRPRIYHPLIPRPSRSPPKMPRLPAPLDKVGSKSSSNPSSSTRPRLHNRDSPNPTPIPSQGQSSSGRQSEPNRSSGSGKKVHGEREPGRGRPRRALSHRQSLTDSVAESVERVTNAAERAGRSLSRAVTGSRERLRSAMRDPSRARSSKSSSGEEEAGGGSARRGTGRGRGRGRRSTDMESMAVHVGDANHVHFGPEVKQGEEDGEGEGEEVGMGRAPSRSRSRSRSKGRGRVYEIDSEEEMMIHRQTMRTGGRRGQNEREEIVRRRDESVETGRGRVENRSTNRSRSVSRAPSPYLDDDFITARSRRRGSVSTAASARESSRTRIGEDDGKV